MIDLLMDSRPIDGGRPHLAWYVFVQDPRSARLHIPCMKSARSSWSHGHNSLEFPNVPVRLVPETVPTGCSFLIVLYDEQEILWNNYFSFPAEIYVYTVELFKVDFTRRGQNFDRPLYK